MHCCWAQENEREREWKTEVIEYCQINRTEHSADKLHLLRAWIGNISLCINFNTGDGIITKHMIPRDAKSQMRPRVTRDCTFYGQNMKINPIMLIMNSSDPKWKIICGLKLSIHSNLLCSQFWAIQKQKKCSRVKINPVIAICHSMHSIASRKLLSFTHIWTRIVRPNQL